MESNNILDEAARLLNEKDANSDIILAGTIILVSTFEDWKYKKQTEFGNEFIYPHKTFDALLRDLDVDPDEASRLICTPCDLRNMPGVIVVKHYGATTDTKTHAYTADEPECPFTLASLINRIGAMATAKTIPFQIHEKAFPELNDALNTVADNRESPKP